VLEQYMKKNGLNGVAPLTVKWENNRGDSLI
jgi:hypothetical protein